MNRRQFLIGTVAVAGVARPGRASARQQAQDQQKLARLAIMSLTFGSILKNANQPDSPARVLDIMDLGQMYADRFGVHNVELQHSYLPSTEPSYLKAFRAKLDKTKSRVSNINLEFGMLSMSADSPVNRLQAIDLTKRWIEHAVLLGSPRVMINQGALTQENKAIAIATLKTMNDYGKSRGVMVSLEPRGGGGGGRAGGRGPGGAAQAGAPGGQPAPASPPPAPPPSTPAEPAYILLTEVIKGAGAYANVDVANFGPQDIQHAGIRAMMPYTVGNTHCRLNPAQYDLPAALKIIREEFHYTGLFSIEQGIPTGPDPYANIQAVRDVMLENM